MGVFDRVMKALKPASGRVGTGFELSRSSAAPPRKGSYELIVAYKYIPWLRAIVAKVSDHVAGVCWTAYKRTDGRPDYGLKYADRRIRSDRIKALVDKGEMKEVSDALILKLLADPNDHLTGRACTKLASTHYELVGEIYLVLDRDPSTGIPVGFWPTPPHWVKKLPDLTQPKDKRFYSVQIAGLTRDVPAADVIAIRDLDPDDPLGRGIGPGFALGDELDSDEYIARFIKNSFWNNAMPAAALAIDDGKGNANQPPPSIKAWTEKLASEFKGPENAGRLLVTNGKLSFARLDSPFKDMQLVELRKFLISFIRMVWGIPPEILGDMTSSNRATSNAAEALFAGQVIVPRLEVLRTEYQFRLVPLLGEDVILDYESPVPADRDFQLRAASAMPSTVEKNEWRALQGLKPRPEFEGQFPSEAPGSKPDHGGNPEPPSPDDESPEADAGRKRAVPGDPLWVQSEFP